MLLDAATPSTPRIQANTCGHTNEQRLTNLDVLTPSLLILLHLGQSLLNQWHQECHKESIEGPWQQGL